MHKTIGQLIFGLFFLEQAALQSQPFTQLAWIKTSGSVSSTRASGEHTYFSEIRDTFSYFKSVDISDPGQPVVIDSFMTAGTILDFDLNGAYAYLS
ncbi:MAG: hypothetical protein ACREOO_19035 [bacterium]